MSPLLWLGLTAAGGGALALLFKEGMPGTMGLPQFPGAQLPYQRANINGIYAIAGKLVKAGVISADTVTFLAVKAYTEARWGWSVGAGDRSNRARGMFGLRPESAWDAQLADISDAMIAAMKDPEWAIVTALDYLVRLGPYVADGVPNAVEMACGWAFPSLAESRVVCLKKRPELFDRWGLALRKSGLPKNWNPVLQPKWPGRAAAYNIVAS